GTCTINIFHYHCHAYRNVGYQILDRLLPEDGNRPGFTCDGKQPKDDPQSIGKYGFAHYYRYWHFQWVGCIICALVAQYDEFVDANMGIGMIIIGLASV